MLKYMRYENRPFHVRSKKTVSDGDRETVVINEYKKS